MGHKAEPLNCQVGRDMTACTTHAIFNPPHPGIVRFMQGEVEFRQRGYRLQCSMSILVCPERGTFMRGKTESHHLSLYY